MALTFIHCSDLHLGRQRLGGKLPENDLAEALRFIVNYTLDQNVEGLLIAGDLFDSPTIQPPHLQMAIDCLTPLRTKGIPVFAIEGNHDRPSLSSEAATWVRYLNDEGYLHLLTIPFTAAGPQITAWDPATRKGSYIDCQGVRIIGAGYLGAGTVRRMRAIAENYGTIHESLAGKPTIMLLHAGPEYMVHEGGGFSHDSLEFLHGFVDYLALGHIHKPLNFGGWAINPGTAENIRLEEARYDMRAGLPVPRGLAAVTFNTTQQSSVPAVSMIAVPRRPVLKVELDCSRLTKQKNLGEQVKLNIMEQARIIGVTPETVLQVELTGELDLQRAGLDSAELAESLETELPVLAVEISLTDLNLPLNLSGAVEDSAGITREALEKQAVLELLKKSALENLNDQQESLADLMFALQEDVRHQISPEDILDRLARHPAVSILAASYAEQRRSESAQTEVAAIGGEPK